MKNDLTCSYAGLKLKNPIVVASCSHTHSVASIKKLAEAGAAAVVIKSLFEEQMEEHSNMLSHEQEHTEAFDYLTQYIKSNELNEHLELIKAAKQAVNIPIIASINCYKAGNWVDFAKQLANAGADALEVNIMRLEASINTDPTTLVREYISIAKDVAQAVNIPVSIKLPRDFSTLVALVDKMHYAGAKGVTLFNRSYRMDIDIENETIVSGNVLTTPNDIADTLRFTGIVATKVPQIEVSASTGIHTATDAVKALLAGASSVQICSTLYLHGAKVIGEILDGIDEWMSRKQYRSVDEFRGKLKPSDEDLNLFSRVQFMKYFSNKE